MMKASVLIAVAAASVSTGAAFAALNGPKSLELRPGDTEVLIAPKATSQTAFAADELTNFLSRVFGAPVPIRRSPTPGMKQIVVGDNEWSRAEGLDPDSLSADDAFLIKATGDRLYLCGVDGDWSRFQEMFANGRGAGMLRGRRSSAFAVYEFLEKYASCRFYWPGRLGEITPRADVVKVPVGVSRHVPKLIIRRYYHPRYENSPWKNNGWIEDDEMTEGQGLTYSWMRLRMGSFNIPCCHGVNWFEFLRRFGKSHPEYFALKKDGSRFTKFEGYGASSYGMLCFSSGVMEELYQDVKSYLSGEGPEVRKIRGGHGGKWEWPVGFSERKYVDIMPNDSQFKCLCEKCRAKYREGDRNFMTELVWGYTRDIANRLIADKVPGYVTQMAYASYSRVPDFDIPTNVMVMVAKTGPFSFRKKDVLETDNSEIRKWKRKTGNVWIWTYPNKYGKLNVIGLPTMTPRAWGRYYQMVSPDIFGAFAESECDRFFFNHLNYYVFSRVCWDPSIDVDAVLDEYYRLCYGAAAPEAKAFCEALEDKFLDEIVGAYEMTPAGPAAKAPSVHEIWTKIYSPAQLDEWGRLLDRGAAKLAAGTDEARRFKLFRDELLGVMRRTSDEYLDKTDAARNARRMIANPPKRNIVKWKGGRWYKDTRDTAEKIVSDASIHLVSTNGGATALYYLDGGDAETLKPDTRYRVSFFVKGRGIKPVRQGGGACITLCDAYNNSFPKPTALAGTFDWVYQTYEHVTSPETGKRCRSYLYLNLSGANGEAWFDGMTIEEIPDQVAEPGKCAVVVAPKASNVTRFAAKELSKFLSRRFGGKAVPVRTEPKDGEFAFVVGDCELSRAAGIDVAKLPRDGFAVKTAPGRVFIAGRDDRSHDIEAMLAKGYTCTFEMASVFGVYDFLERVADCRFFFPGELGEAVRRGDDLPLQKLDYTSAPDFTARSIYNGSRCEYFDPSDKSGMALNSVRTRMETEKIPCCHGLRTHNYIKRFGKTHPEYFALQQGRRNIDPNYRHPQQFCFSNEGFKDEVYKDIVKAFKSGAKYFDCMPQDEMVACECEKCRAAYAKGPKGQPATDLVWGMVGEWGRRLIKDGIKGDLTLLAYSPYKAVPSVDLPTNVQVMVAVSGPFSMNNPDALRKDDELIEAWTKKVGHRVWLWTYPDKYGNRDIKGVPSVAANAWARYYPQRANMIFGAFAESETERWFQHCLNYYVYGKTSWDNSINPVVLTADFYNRLFGTSHVQWYMSEFMRSLESKWMKDVCGRVVMTETGPKTSTPTNRMLWEEIYSPSVLAGYDKMLTSARKAAAGMADPLVAKRVDLFRAELYAPLKKESDIYFARRKAVADQLPIRAGVAEPLVPFDPSLDTIFGKKAKNLPERDVTGTAKVWRDENRLWFFFDLVEPRMADTLKVERKRDERLIWMDNSVEVHFCPTGDRDLVYQIIVNELGSHSELQRVAPGKGDSLGWDWNPDLDIKTSKTDRGWTCLISVSLDSFEPMVDKVPMEFARSRMLNRTDKYHQLFHVQSLVRSFGSAEGFRLVDFSGNGIDVLPGKCAVVIDANASGVVKFAADELSKFLSRRFGGKAVPVRTEPKDGEFAFVVGDCEISRAAGIDVAKLPRDAFRVKVDRKAGRAYIAGRDEKGGLNVLARCKVGSIRFERGSLHGVYDFLERFAGCRFYFPGELGEVVPAGDSLALAGDEDYVSAPDFTTRRVYDGPGSKYFEEVSSTDPRFLQQIRNRMETEGIPCCHGLNAFCYLKRFGKSHPEYFALSQGVRQNGFEGKHIGQLCFSSGIREEIYQDVKSYLKGEGPEKRGVPKMKGEGFEWNYNCAGRKYVDVMPQDSLTLCQCPDCQRKITNAVSKDACANELIWDNVIDWAERLKKERIPGNLTMMSYHPYQNVPERAMPNNIQVMIAVTGPFGKNNAVARRRDDSRIRAWKEKLGHRVWLWTYPNKYGPLELPGIPQFSMHEWGEFYRSRRDLIFGAFAECESERWFNNHLNQYVFGRVMWDNGADIERILDEYASGMFGHGEAGTLMRSIIADLESKWMNDVTGAVSETPVGPVMTPPSDDVLWGEVYSAKFIESLRERMERARSSALASGNELAARRVDLYLQEIYEPLKAASKRYYDHKAAVDALPVWKTGEWISLVPYDQPLSGVWGKERKLLPERDIKAKARLLIDEKNLVFEFENFEPEIGEILAVKRPQDDPYMWQDNGVEMFFNPSGDRINFYQIIVNSEGSLCDITKKRMGQDSILDRKWVSNAKITIKKESDRWLARISVPRSSIPEAFKFPMPVNFCRSRVLKPGHKNHAYFISSPLASSYGDVLGFGTIEVSR